MAEPMSEERLAEIESREQAATEGPWWFDEDDMCWRLHGVMGRIPPQMDGIIPEQILNKQILKAAKRNTPYAEYWPGPADAEFIAHARQDVSDLLAEVKRLRDRQDSGYLVDILTGSVLLGADDAVGMLRALIPELVEIRALTAEQAARVHTGLDKQAADVERLRGALADEQQRASDLDLIRLAISDPGAFVKRERFNNGDHETVPAWGARAVVMALQEGRGNR